MATVLLRCGQAPVPVTLSGEDFVTVSDVPTREELMTVLPATTAAERVVVFGDDAALAAVLTHLLRFERLDIALAYVPEHRTPACRVYRLEHGAAAAKKALTAPAVPTPLIRDDLGVALVGRAAITGPDDAQLEGETYVDENRLFTGTVAAVEIRPTIEEPGVQATRVGGLRRRRWRSGRAAQTGMVAGRLVRDGVPERKTLKRSTFYRNLDDWLLVR